ncbi:MAG: UDP-N-acetylmuramoyl-L-alanine--D-glutamate ligase [Candidatus Omnitrophica bacterium]|nr:UDP-N-acetylmuramoyl-L-alanine--D-glutamate ligase [Candidatus Omnitrophota bacterium]
MIDLRGKKVLVVGLGSSGRSSAELLQSKGALVKITEGSDSDPIRKNLERVKDLAAGWEIGGHTEKFCLDTDLVVTSPGVDPQALPLDAAKAGKIPVIGELELGYLFTRAPIIAVTGTNGKSTTTKLIGRILSMSGRDAVVCGNIGNPLTGEVENLREDSIAVVEVSSFQLETVKRFRPFIAVLLNISEDHYDRHGDLARYTDEKFRIFANQLSDDWAVLHSSFRKEERTGAISSRKLFFGKEGPDMVIGDGTLVTPEGVLLKESDMALKGVHNLENVASAAIAARIMGVDDGCIKEAVRGFSGLDHRFQTVSQIDGVRYIDDSKATNIDATQRALESVEGKVILIAGGRDKGGDYRSILRPVREKVKRIVAIGEAADKINEAFSSYIPVDSAKDMSEAIRVSAECAAAGDTVLLSPMCSSFDMFTDYKHRGVVFQREVRRMTEEK